MYDYNNSTVAAISTPQGKGGIAVIRVSGDKAVEICEKVFFPISKKLSEISANTATYGHIYYNGEKIDDGMATVFIAPKSFTGEDTVEISCHGSVVGASMVLSALFDAGALPAQAGEFTKRAFLSGKINLSGAEAIGELIDAETGAAQLLSAAKLSGVLGKKIEEIAEKITSVLESVYAYIDYPDEDIADMTVEEMRKKTEEILGETKALCDSYDAGRAISKGIPAAIVGKPNVGKSSFLNLLLGFERAIVTDISGTTRDVITESVTVGNIRLLLSDTAGIHSTDDYVEKIGVQRSMRELRDSELIFLIFDVSGTPTEEDREIIQAVAGKNDKKIIALLNKSDLGTSYAEEYLSLITEHGIENAVSFSAKESLGKETLLEILEKLYPAGDEKIRSGLIVTNARQHASLTRAVNALRMALSALETLTPDMCCAELESALSSLLELDGRSINEKIVDGIFSHFCVGK